MPIYDKPMIYYPLSVLMLAGIRHILIISTPQDLPRFNQLLGDGNNIGVKFEYLTQPSPDGIAQALIIGKDFVGKDDVSLILGDNVYYGNDLSLLLSNALSNVKNKIATVFAYQVKNPENYAVIQFKPNGNVKSIQEKPKIPKSKYVLTGLYFYPNDVLNKASKISPSKRGELEITSINENYLNEKKLFVEIMGRGYAWLDTGTHESLLEASNFVETLEKRQGQKIACIEEIAYRMNFIDIKKLKKLAEKAPKNEYGEYLLSITKEYIN